MRISIAVLLWALLSGRVTAAVPDQPFLQDRSVRLSNALDLTNATFRKLCIDKEDVPYVLTDKGVARAFGNQLAPDRSFRPLAGQAVRDLALSPSGDLYYLLDDRWLSNGENGRPLGHVPAGKFTQIAVVADGTVLLAGNGSIALARQNELRPLPIEVTPRAIFAATDEFYVLGPDKILRIKADGSSSTLIERSGNTLALHGDELLVGTSRGFYGVNRLTGEITSPLESKVPNPEISRISSTESGLWFGSRRGAFFVRTKSGGPTLPDGPTGFRYYASERWLKDDDVVDLGSDSLGNVWILTRTGLTRLELEPMTLAQKAAYFDHKVRNRHIRFGLTGERRLPVAGDTASSEIIDTDNDGGWSSYYLASQAFRYAVTRESRAKANAWETFAALERLQSINPLPGFPARTFERAGFKVSDPDRWRELPGKDWEWKGHTSSDEIASQTFAHAVLWECAAENSDERQRIARNFTRIADHILEHKLYLVDIDGKPTLWGRWNPEYVNWFPPSVFDRRLNSAEITATLQFAYRVSGNEAYRQKAEELFEQHGYLTNILSSMKLIKATPGIVHLGINMGDEWNHSDDELAFVTYWVLSRFAFTDELKASFNKAIHEHWEFERPEQYPMWNFIYSGCGGGTKCDVDGAVWTLRGFPLDTITWRIENASRKDIHPLPANFMGRELRELLPPGERPIVRCNTQPFILDGGDGGHIEFPGDEFLLGYWLGRYLQLIE